MTEEEKVEASKNRLIREKQKLETEVTDILNKLSRLGQQPTPGLDQFLMQKALVDVLVAKGIFLQEEIDVRFLELSKEVFTQSLLAAPPAGIHVPGHAAPGNGRVVPFPKGVG